jgi:hypothetical protein
LVRTPDRVVRQIAKGRVKGIEIKSGTVRGNDHFGRIVIVDVPGVGPVNVAPEHLELIDG